MNNKENGIRVGPAILENYLCHISINWSKDGKSRRWEAVKRILTGRVDLNKFDGIAVVVPVTDEKELVFISQFRATIAAIKAKKNEEIDENDLRFHEITFPAGLADKDGLTIQEIAELELAEEAKLGARKYEEINSGMISAGMSFEQETTFLATGLHPVLDKEGDEQTRILIYKVPIESALEWLKNMRNKGCEIDSRVVPMIYQVKAILRGE